jgi:dTDP-4-amino-4,6-dideoxygalactose transaminase
VDQLCTHGAGFTLIPISSPLAAFQAQQDDIRARVLAVFDSGAYVLGPEVAGFEQSFSEYCQAAYGIGVKNGTDALILALKALGIGPGDEVVTVSHTALATVSAVLAAGATPVLVDIDPIHYTLDPTALADVITTRTKAIVPVHLYGQAADMDPILEVAARYRIPVIEDCAQATGATYKGRRVGSIGEVSCFSFYPTKNLGAIGDGGMVVTNNRQIADRVRRIRQYGWDESRSTDQLGINSRLDEIQAAILAVKLPLLDRNNDRRTAIARRYSDSFAGLPITVPVERPESAHVYHLYVVSCDDRDGLRQHLMKHQILAGVHYPVAAHRHGGYTSRVSISPKGLASTDRLVNRIISLPIYPELTDMEVERVIVAVSSYFEL